MAMSIFSSNGNHLVFNALCCCNVLISQEFAKNIGCSCLNECICIKQECCLKIDQSSLGCVCCTPVLLELMICKVACFCVSCGLKKPNMLAKSKGDCFCMRSQLTLPPDDDTPSIFALCGLLLYPSVGCCKKFSDVK